MGIDDRIRAVLLPPMAWQPERDAFRPGESPDPFEIYNRMAQQGIDTVLIDPGRRPLNPFAGRATLLEALDQLRALRVLLAERHADIIVSVFEGAALPLVMLHKLAAFRVPIVLWDIGLTESWKLRERVLDLVVPRVDGIFVLSASQVPYINARWGRTKGLEVVGQHLDTTFFASKPPMLSGPVLAIGEDVGRDFETFLAAAEGVDAEFLVKTRQIRPDRVLPSRVRVMRERVNDLGLRDLYAQSRFVVIPLHQVPNASGVSSILEASSTGRALIVSDAKSIRDFVIPDETCLCVPCGDPTALRAAIQRLLNEPDTCSRLGANGRRYMEQNFSNSVFADRMGKMLKSYARPRPWKA